MARTKVTREKHWSGDVKTRVEREDGSVSHYRTSKHKNRDGSITYDRVETYRTGPTGYDGGNSDYSTEGASTSSPETPIWFIIAILFILTVIYNSFSNKENIKPEKTVTPENKENPAKKIQPEAKPLPTKETQGISGSLKRVGKSPAIAGQNNRNSWTLLERDNESSLYGPKDIIYLHHPSLDERFYDFKCRIGQREMDPAGGQYSSLSFVRVDEKGGCSPELINSICKNGFWDADLKCRK